MVIKFGGNSKRLTEAAENVLSLNIWKRFIQVERKQKA